MRKLTDYLNKSDGKFSIFLRLYIEKNTRCGIMFVRLVDTKSAEEREL